MCSRTSIVQCRKNARRSTLLDEIAHDLVVEIFDRCPFDLLPDIFLLLRLQSKFDENLLQLLVDVVDTELLERIILENNEHFPRYMISMTNIENFKSEDVLDKYIESSLPRLEKIVSTYKNADDMSTSGAGFHRDIDP